MTKKQKQLVNDYGMKFLERSRKIETELLYLSGDAASVMTDNEWQACSERLVEFVEELDKVRQIVRNRLRELEPWLN